MRIPRQIVVPMLTAALVAGATLGLAPSASASASGHHQLGTKSLAAVLTSDGNTFDKNWFDYDITTQAVLAVLKAKPKSAVGVLTDGKTPVTAFVPDDRAFRVLVHDLTGKWLKKESNVFKTVAGLGIPTVETILLYHVVPGATLDSGAVLKSNGAKLKTAQGGTVKVNVYKCWHHTTKVTLSDKDYNSRNPRVITLDINKGNKQIAHGIDRVLRPVNL